MKKKRAGAGGFVKDGLRRWNKKAILGLALLLVSFLMGAVLKSSAQIATSPHPRGFSGACDTYLTWLCIPTYYFTIQIDASDWLVVNATSFLTSLVLFILGIKFVRE